MKSQYLRFFFVAFLCFSPLILGFWLLLSAPVAPENDTENLPVNSANPESGRLFLRGATAELPSNWRRPDDASTPADSQSATVNERMRLVNQLRNEVIAQNVLGVLGAVNENVPDFNESVNLRVSGSNNQLHKQRGNGRIRLEFSLVDFAPDKDRNHLATRLDREIFQIQSELNRQNFELTPRQSWADFAIKVENAAANPSIELLASSDNNRQLHRLLEAKLRSVDWRSVLQELQLLDFHLHLNIIPGAG